MCGCGQDAFTLTPKAAGAARQRCRAAEAAPRWRVPARRKTMTASSRLLGCFSASYIFLLMFAGLESSLRSPLEGAGGKAGETLHARPCSEGCERLRGQERHP